MVVIVTVVIILAIVITAAIFVVTIVIFLAIVVLNMFLLNYSGDLSVDGLPVVLNEVREAWYKTCC